MEQVNNDLKQLTIIRKQLILFRRGEVLFFTLIAIALAKIIRWSPIGKKLIDNAIGHGFLSEIINNETGFALWSFDNSSVAGDTTVLLFSILNIFNLKTFAQFEVMISIIFNIIMIYFIYVSVHRWRVFQTIFFVFSIGILNIFSFTLSKEPIQMISFLFIYGIIRNKSSLNRKLILLVIFLVSTALIFRAYYILMLMFFVVIHWYLFLLKPRSKFGRMSIIAVIIFIYLMFLIALRYYDADTYTQIHYLRSANRLDQYNTGIKPIISSFRSSDILLTLDSLLVILRLMFPIELIFTKTSTGLFENVMIVIYQAFISLLVIKNTKKWVILSNEKRIALECFYSFLIMSSIFEPDFGSWIRHQSVAIPILLILLNIFPIRCSRKRYKQYGNTTIY